MKNPFERLTSPEQYDATEKKVEKQRGKLEKLEAPLGHLDTDGLFANLMHEGANSLASLPNLPEIQILKLRVKMGERKLQKMYERSHEEALKLAEEHNRLIERAAESQSALRKFEMEKLGMSDDEVAAGLQEERAA